MPIDHPAIEKLKAQFPAVKFRGSDFRGQVQVIVPAESLPAVVSFLKDEPSLQYNMICDLTCVDYFNHSGPPQEGRFGLVYIFNSVDVGVPRITLRVFLQENNAAVESIVPIFAGAEFLEREVYDMFGITFTNHPDLRRLLTWDGFPANPLRKDYPVTGRGEREQYPILTRDSV